MNRYRLANDKPFDWLPTVVTMIIFGVLTTFAADQYRRSGVRAQAQITRMGTVLTEAGAVITAQADTIAALKAQRDTVYVLTTHGPTRYDKHLDSISASIRKMRDEQGARWLRLVEDTSLVRFQIDSAVRDSVKVRKL